MRAHGLTRFTGVFNFHASAASLFVACVLEALIPAGVAFFSDRSTPAPTLDLNSGDIAPPSSHARALKKFLDGRNMGIHSPAFNSSDGFPRPSTDYHTSAR